MPAESKLFIKGMVCDRCLLVIEKELEDLGYTVDKIGLGQVTVIVSDQPLDMHTIGRKLEQLGFNLLEDKKVRAVNHIKELVSKVYSGNYDFPIHFRFSDLVFREFSKEYDYISGIFSLAEQKTLEQYILQYRVSKIKELLITTSLTISDIAFKLNFSSIAHLSRQFKKFTGYTPSDFRQAEQLSVLAQVRA